MQFNPNKLFRWLSIRTKLIIAFTSLSIIPLLLVGVYSVISNARALENVAMENLSHDVFTMKEHTRNFLANLETDLNYLRRSFVFQEFLKTLERPNPRLAQRFSDLEKQVLTFVETRGVYYQVRFLSTDGDELFRVEAPPSGPRIAPHAEFKDGSSHFYRLLVSNLDSSQIAIVPAEILDDEGEVLPVVSYVLPIIEKGSRKGILVANIFSKELFSVLEGERHIEMGGKVILVSGEGYFLYHSEKKKDWNKLLASREDANLWSEYPEEVVTEILSGKTGMVSATVDDMIFFTPLFEGKSGLTNTYYILEAVPKEIILQPVKSFGFFYIGMVFLFLVGSVGLGFLATSQLAGPIRTLKQGAEIISKGNYDHRLRIETKDEIELLANQFNRMAESLQKHEDEIQMHRQHLEQLVAGRTEELSAEKTKLQAILDNVPSAFVLLDRESTILSASAAFESITGYSVDQVRGKNCCEIFLKEGFCNRCLPKIALETGEIETSVDKCRSGNHEEKYLEHISIPLKENGEIVSFIEIITDVTKRKRLEEHLIQTEKLMAAGEMASIIAHEFRNSLTSIKMILELQQESKRLTRSDLKSLNVALNSIEHMEGIVTELLNFARPKPMEFQPERLSEVVNEAVTFSTIHLEKQKIELKKRLDLSLPAISMDAPRLKDALINLLLNAAQALDGVELGNGRGEIRVLTRKMRLRATLRDFAPAKETGLVGAASLGDEIVLRKGTQCALVEISDTGCGIVRDHLHRIFDPFFTTKPNGTGLGLSMVKQTVNAHGGIVTVESKRGRGTAFRIYLPLSNRG